MEYSNCIIAIEGNHLHQSKQIFECFSYLDRYNDQPFKQWEEVKKYLTDNFESREEKGEIIRGLWFENGWTLICDPEMSDTISDEPFELLAEKLKTKVLIFLCISENASYYFAKYNPKKQRGFSTLDEEINENTGEPLIEEKGLKINEKITFTEINEIAKRFGIELDSKSTTTEFLVKHLSHNAEAKEKAEEIKKMVDEENQKPWWKFW